MGYMIFRGWRTETDAIIPTALSPTNNKLANVYVMQMPSHKKAGKRFTEYYVKGRDGALHVEEGYSNYDLQCMVVLLNTGAETRYAVNAWADGTGKLITSDDPTRAYIASVEQGVVWQRVKAATAVPAFSSSKNYVSGDICQYNGNIYKFSASHSGSWSGSDAYLIAIPNGFYDCATIQFNCQPAMVEAIDTSISLSATGSIINPGTAVSYPLITVSGSGDASFSVNGNEIEIDDMTSGTPVNIDCATGYVYTASGATAIRGEIPYFDLGTNTITFGNNVSSMTIVPHWRWL